QGAAGRRRGARAHDGDTPLSFAAVEPAPDPENRRRIVDFLQQARIVRRVAAGDADAERRRAAELLFGASAGFPVAKLLTCLVTDEVRVGLGIGQAAPDTHLCGARA